MLEIMNERSKKDEVEKRPITIEGTVSTGDLKGKSFIVYLGDSPSKAQLVIDNQIMPCSRIEIVVDRGKPVIEIKFDCWFLPEE